MSRLIGQKTDYLGIFNYFQKDKHFSSVGKLLGKGSFGEVRDIAVKNKIMAGKVVKMKNFEKNGEYIAYDLRGQNIIKINRIIQKNIDGEDYYLIIMEKAILRDLGKLTDYFHNHNLLKLIFNPFNEVAGDNLIRFYSKQIVNAMEILHRSNYVHFDLKPENLLISISLIIKLSDFSLLKKINEIEAFFGRDRKKEIRFGPRTLDLDIELFGEENIKTPLLEIPHPRMKERAFVLIPTIEILTNSADINLKKEYEKCLEKLRKQGTLGVEKICSYGNGNSEKWGRNKNNCKACL